MKAKVLIVDDEPMICKGLRLTIPWAQMGAEVVGEAYDGVQALQMIAETSADLIVTDVRMPRMDGIELVETLYGDDHFLGKIVMLSGYEEFAYVRKALQFGVKDYLLKPVDPDELIALLSKLLRDIADETERKTAQRREAYYRYIAQEMMENAAEAPLPQPASPCRFIVSRIGEYHRWVDATPEPEQNRMRARWKEELDDAFQQVDLPAVSLFLQQNLLLTVVPEPEGAVVSSQTIQELMDGCSERLSEHGHGLRLEWLAEEQAVVLSGLKEQVQHVIRRLHQGMTGFSALFGSEGEPARAETMRASSADYPKETEQKLLDALFQHKQEEVRAAVADLFAQFRRQGYALPEAFHVCQEMHTMVERRFRATAGLKELGHRLPNLKAADLNVYNSFAAVEHLFAQALAQTGELLRLANFGKNHWIIDRVTAYIQQHYAQEMQSRDVADKLRVTPNYFSSIFKQETGKSFHEYVNEVRVAKAQELLLTTSELVGTIALAVGYKEYKYFANIFKKYSGVAPSEYRDLHTTLTVSGDPAGGANLL